MTSELQCKRCGHTWVGRGVGKPRWCPNKKCHSPYWDTEAGQKRGPKGVTGEAEEGLVPVVKAENAREERLRKAAEVKAKLAEMKEGRDFDAEPERGE